MELELSRTDSTYLLFNGTQVVSPRKSRQLGSIKTWFYNCRLRFRTWFHNLTL